MVFEAMKNLEGLKKITDVLDMLLNKLVQHDQFRSKKQRTIEQSLRLTLNILFKFSLSFNEEQSIAAAVQKKVHLDVLEIEKVCIKAMFLAQQVEVVPVKKFIIILKIYLQMLFGRDTRPSVADPNEESF